MALRGHAIAQIKGTLKKAFFSLFFNFFIFVIFRRFLRAVEYCLKMHFVKKMRKLKVPFLLQYVYRHMSQKGKKQNKPERKGDRKMKNKILLTSALALAISVPAMAADPTPTTVTSTSSCTETTLGTATGPVDIEADWQANTINLTWDANNGTVSGGPKQCTYDGTFTLPTSITRTGYNFTGWKVVQAACAISDYDVANTPTAYGSIALSGKSIDDYYNGGATAATYGLTQPGDWGLTLASGGKVTGKAVCATSAPEVELYNNVQGYVMEKMEGIMGGTITENEFISGLTAITGSSKGTTEARQLFNALATNDMDAVELQFDNLIGAIAVVRDTAPSSTGGGEAKYCYCGASSYTSSSGETCTAASRWVFDGDVGSASDCASDCANNCGDAARDVSGLRAGLFGPGN